MRLERYHDRANTLVLWYRQALEATARERRIPLVSVPLLTTTPDPELFLDAFHPNRRGHILLALALERFLRLGPACNHTAHACQNVHLVKMKRVN